MREARTPATTTAAILAELARTDMVTTRRRLQDIGVTDSAINGRVAAGTLVRLGRGVVGLAAVDDPIRQARRSAVLGHPDALLAFETAAELHAMPIGDVGVGVQLLAHRDAGRRSQAACLTTTRHLPAEDRCVVDGFPVTSLERTFLDLFQRRSLRFILWLGQRLIVERQMNPDRLEACAIGLSRRGRAFTVSRRRVVAELLPDEPLLDSAAEDAFASLCREHGIDDLAPQFVPPWFDGHRGIVDFARPSTRHIVEVDGRRWHATSQAQEEDRRRERTARRHGWKVERFSYTEIVQRPAWVVETLREFLDA